MSQTIKIPNYTSTSKPSNLTGTTRLDADAAAAASTITVQNTQGFTAADFIIIGTPGSDTTEMLTIQTITPSTTITPTTALKLPHSKYSYVYGLVGNQIKVYRAPNVNNDQPADSAFTVLATVSIQDDQAYTTYIDSVGSSAYWYKYTYYNATSLFETNLADSTATRGGDAGNYCSLDSIRLESGFRNAQYITDDMIDAKRKAAQDEINGTLNGFYITPFVAPINAFISDITVRLAAGLLLTEQYNVVNKTNNINGLAKIKSARDDLNKINLKEIVLTDANGVSFALDGSTGGASSWPNETTAATDISQMSDGQDGGHVFSMADLLGYFGRKY
jgi:hypothetical protein